jgi:pimeloyl-ACP methyl ester carboxylesterase
MIQTKRSRLARSLLRFLTICWLGWSGFFWDVGQRLQAGVFRATNLGGEPVVDKLGIPVFKLVGAVEILYGHTVVASGRGYIEDGYFDLGLVTIPEASGPTELIVRVWDYSVGASFAATVASWYSGAWGYVSLVVPLVDEGQQPVNLVQAGLKNLHFFRPDYDSSVGWVWESFVSFRTNTPPQNTMIFLDSIDPANDLDFHAFNMEKGQRVEVTLNGEASLDGYLVVETMSGYPYASNDDGVRPGSVSTNRFDSYLRYTATESAVHFVGVSRAGIQNPLPVGKTFNSTPALGGKYRLQISYGIAGAVIGDGVADFMREDQLRMAIEPNRTTWVVIHGWGSSRNDETIKRLISAVVAARPGVQVLSLDWSAMAGGQELDGRLVAAKSIVPVAKWAAAVMQDYGFKPERLHFIGHSMGAHLADEIAKLFPSKVASLMAIDPAANCCGEAFDPIANGEVDFARDARASWAFYGSPLGREELSLRANESFLVESSLPPLEAHQRVLKVVTALIGAATNSFPATFGLGRLEGGAPGPWGTNQFASGFPDDRQVRGFEALIRSTNQGGTISVQYLTNGPVVTAGFAPRQTEVPQVVVEGTVSGLPSGSGPGWVAINGIAAHEMVSTEPGTIRWRSRLPLHRGANEFEVSTLSGPSGTVLSTVLMEEVYAQDPSTSPRIQIELAPKNGDASRFLLKVTGAPLIPAEIEESSLVNGWYPVRNGVLELDPQQPDGRGHFQFELTGEWYLQPRFFRARYLDP